MTCTVSQRTSVFLTRWVLLTSLFSFAAVAQIRINIDIPVPTIVFPAPPPLVVIQPGVQVVQDLDDEVFFVEGYYWCRREGRWFRTRSHQGGWVVVESSRIPAALVQLPPGQYKKWRGKGHEHGKKKGKGKKGDD